MNPVITVILSAITLAAILFLLVAVTSQPSKGE